MNPGDLIEPVSLMADDKIGCLGCNTNWTAAKHVLQSEEGERRIDRMPTCMERAQSRSARGLSSIGSLVAPQLAVLKKGRSHRMPQLDERAMQHNRTFMCFPGSWLL